MTGPMTDERLGGIERELRESLVLHHDSRDPRGCQGPALRLAAKEVPALVEEVRRLRGALVRIRKHINGQCRCASLVSCLDNIDTIATRATPGPEGT